MRDITVRMQVSGTPVDPFPVSSPTTWWDTIWAHVAQHTPVWTWWIVGALLALAALALTFLLLKATWQATSFLWRRHVSPRPTEDVLTVVAASIATAVSAQGMWLFTGDVLGLSGPLRLMLFAFIEIAVITSAVRARRNMRENFSAGVDGIAVWGLTVLTAVLSAMHPSSFPEKVFRLAAPLVAAWLWERGMAIERHRIRGTKGIHWRITPERLLVRVGLAEIKDRTASDVDTHRRLKRVALAAKKHHQLVQASAKEKKVAAALTARDRALDLAVEHTDLATNPRTQALLLDLVTAVGGADSLSEVLGAAKAPWAMLDHPAVTGAAKHREAIQLAEAMREWTNAIKAGGDPESTATIRSLAAYITRREGQQAPEIETSDETTQPVADQVEVEVSQAEIDAMIERYRNEPAGHLNETRDETADETRATEAMWARWQEIVQEERRIPTGKELADAGKCSPQYGARMRRQWLEAMDGRTRRALEAGKRAAK